MRLKFWACGTTGPSEQELQRTLDQVRKDCAEAVEACSWFNDRLCAEFLRAEEAVARADQAQTVAACLGKQLAEEQGKVRALEEIAGPYVPSDAAPSPIYSEITREIGLPDPEATLNIPVTAPPVMSLVALGARP